MVLYEKVFEARTDEQTYTSIWAVVNMEKETVEFKYDGKRYKRKLRRDGAYVGFTFRGWFFKREAWEK